MIADPSIAAQRAVYAVLAANAPLVALLGGVVAIYDRPPANAVLPWLTFGDDDIRDDGTADFVGDGELDGAAVTAEVHVWCDGMKSQCKRIAAVVAKALAVLLDLSADNQRCVTVLVESIRHLSDPDGKTWHSIVTVTYRTEPTA